MKKIIRVSLIIFTILIVSLYCLSCLTPYLSPTSYPFLTVISIIYLPILILYGLTTVVWLFCKKRIFIILLLLLFAGYKSLFSTVAINASTASWNWKKDSSNIRIMSWNVNRFGTPYTHTDSANGIRQQMLRYIQYVQPDVICMQDFRHNEVVNYRNSFVDNISDVLKAGGFSFFYYPFFYEYDGPNYCDKFGVAIFSKFPIIDTGSIVNTGYVKNERSGFADIIVQSKKIRIYTSHLSSMSLWPSNKAEAGIKYLEGDSTEIKAKNIYSKIKYFGETHAQEAAVIKQFINKSPYSVVFTGDLNSVPSSYVYNYLKRGLNDAFLEADAGIGGTYNRVFPKLRIDVLLHSPELKVVQFIRPVTELSDHYPLIADIRWAK
jgi:endonuclease/exonuclease/phosphatase family metal-dependent hydrolase